MSSSIETHKAQAIVAEIKKLLILKGQWFKVTEEYTHDGLKFFKIEASIKVKQ